MGRIYQVQPGKSLSHRTGVLDAGDQIDGRDLPDLERLLRQGIVKATDEFTADPDEESQQADADQLARQNADLHERISDLEDSLAVVTKQRDELTAQVSKLGAENAELKATLDAATAPPEPLDHPEGKSKSKIARGGN